MVERVLKDSPKIDTTEKLINVIFSQEAKAGKGVKA